MRNRIRFDEFKFNEIEIHEYLQMPRILLTNDYFKDLSIDAVILYTLLLDTYKLSTKNNWRDEEGKVYIKFSIGRICEFLRCKTNKAIKVLKELDDENGLGLIHIKKQKQGLPNLIYVNNYYNQELFNQESLKNYEGKDLNNLESTWKNQVVEKNNHLEKTSRVLGKNNQSLLGKTNTSNNEYINNNNSNNECISTAEADSIPYKEIISYLNEKAKTNFKHTAYKNKSLIKARRNEGNRLNDFKKVIDTKTRQWINNNDMKKYIRPSTLFGNKFDEYLNENNSNSYSNNSNYSETARKKRLKKYENSKNKKTEKYDSDSYFDIDKMIEQLNRMGN